jgi:hypothetical protein
MLCENQSRFRNWTPRRWDLQVEIHLDLQQCKIDKAWRDCTTMLAYGR